MIFVNDKIYKTGMIKVVDGQFHTKEQQKIIQNENENNVKYEMNENNIKYEMKMI